MNQLVFINCHQQKWSISRGKLLQKHHPQTSTFKVLNNFQINSNKKANYEEKITKNTKNEQQILFVK
jgi:hypothetical protein